MNIVLIGYRGTGKSSVADLLGARLNRPVFHMDSEIVARVGMEIPHIVSRYGWDHFRDLESVAVAEVTSGDHLVIDTGGGVIVRETNVRSLRKNGIIIWLKALPRTIAHRIKDDTARPSLTGDKSFLAEIEEVLNERKDRYRAAADHAIDTDHLSPEEVADIIVGIVGDKGWAVSGEQ